MFQTCRQNKSLKFPKSFLIHCLIRTDQKMIQFYSLLQRLARTRKHLWLGYSRELFPPVRPQKKASPRMLRGLFWTSQQQRNMPQRTVRRPQWKKSKRDKEMLQQNHPCQQLSLSPLWSMKESLNLQNVRKSSPTLSVRPAGIIELWITFQQTSARSRVFLIVQEPMHRLTSTLLLHILKFLSSLKSAMMPTGIPVKDPAPSRISLQFLSHDYYQPMEGLY